MLKDLGNFLFASEGYGRIRQPGDPVSETCRNISQLRHQIIDYANVHNAYLRDENNNAVGLKPGVCDQAVIQLTNMFNSLAYSPALHTHATTLAGTTARALRDSISAQATRARWRNLPEEAKMNSLGVLSKVFVKRINNNEGSPLLILNDPMLIKGTLPKGIAMHVNSYSPPNQDMNIRMISIDKGYLANSSFDVISAMLWHEHQHIHMAALREAFENGEIEPGHELHEDLRKSTIMANYNIVGNYSLSKDVYMAEPEEKLCYHAQSVFYRVLHYVPPSPANNMAP